MARVKGLPINIKEVNKTLNIYYIIYILSDSYYYHFYRGM